MAIQAAIATAVGAALIVPSAYRISVITRFEAREKADFTAEALAIRTVTYFLWKLR